MASRASRDDEWLALRLEEIAELLEEQQANPFRIRAYRNAAETLRGLDVSVVDILESEGLEGLQRLPGIGESLARALEQLAHTGHLDLLDRLRGEAGVTDRLRTVPGLGPELARRIHEELGIENLPELELAAWDGRLERLPGMGPRRVQAVRESLAGRLGRRSRTMRAPMSRSSPEVAELLDVDREYREEAAARRLPCIAPRRFNPRGEAWLPILHTRRGPRHYTAVFSNTRLAHELGRTRDWVVIYRDDHGGDGQWTVVTEFAGPRRGRRVVRGREAEGAA